MGFDGGEVSILITDDPEIRDLNSRYRNKDKATDVLSFSQREGEGSCFAGDMLGDIVISLDTACRQAEERGVLLEEELLRLLIHGMLHLAGYDHEGVLEAEARRMEEKERELFEAHRKG